MSTNQDDQTDAMNPRAASPVPDDTPAKKKIDELREQAKLEQTKRKDAELKIQQIDAEIGALGQVTDDIEKIAADYLKEHSGLTAARQDDQHFETDETKCLANILGKAVDTVSETVKKLRQPIVDLQKSIDDEAVNLDTYKKARDTNEGIRNDKKKAFDDLKATAATIKNYQKDPLETLEREIKAAHDAGKFGVAYWLLVFRFAGKLGDAPKIPSPPDFRRQLIEARDAYVKAIADFYGSDTLVKATEKSLEAKKAELAEKKKNFEVEVREELSKIEPQRQAA